MKRDGDKERLTITSGHSRFSLQTLSADDFPDLAVGEIGHEFTMEAGDLKRLIDKTRFAISTEETRYYLNGIYLHPAESGEHEDVARGCDRRASPRAGRAAAAERRGGHARRHRAEEDGARAARLLEDSSAKVKVGVSQTKVRFEIGPVVLTSKLIDGTFPDYGRVIPHNNDKEMKVPNASFKSAVDRVSTIASERGRAVKLNVGKDKLILTVNNPEGGSATEEIAVGYTARPARDRFQCALSARHRRTARERRCALFARRSGLTDDGARRRRRQRALRSDADAGLVLLVILERMSVNAFGDPALNSSKTQCFWAFGASCAGSPTFEALRALGRE